MNPQPGTNSLCGQVGGRRHPGGVEAREGGADSTVDVGSLMVALFVVLAGLYFHRFWTIEDPAQRQMQSGNFFRNVALLGVSLMMF